MEHYFFKIAVYRCLDVHTCEMEHGNLIEEGEPRNNWEFWTKIWWIET